MLEKLKSEIAIKYEQNSNIDLNNLKTEQKMNDSLFSSRNKLKNSITQLKMLHNSLEDNYVVLLKNLSKKIIKPKDLFKKPES